MPVARAGDRRPFGVVPWWMVSVHRRAAVEVDLTEQEKQKAEALIARLEVAVGEIAPRDGATAPLIVEMIQSLNGLRSVLGLAKSVH